MTVKQVTNETHAGAEAMTSFTAKAEAVRVARAAMESSKMVCLNDAVRLFQTGREELANDRLEKAAQYAWGFNRPTGWK